MALHQVGLYSLGFLTGSQHIKIILLKPKGAEITRVPPAVPPAANIRIGKKMFLILLFYLIVYTVVIVAEVGKYIF